MDQVSFRSDTVLSEVHLLLPNLRHLMVRLNAAGQPVFITQFKILQSREACCGDESTHRARGKEGPPKARAEEEEEEVRDKEENPAPTVVMDEDGDLDVKRLPRLDLKARDEVHPTILSWGEQNTIDEVQVDEEECAADTIKIEHTMATPLEDAGKQVWRGALLLADFVLSQPKLFKGATVLELGAGMGLTSLVMATVAKQVYCTDVGHDLLTMCQRNMMLNQHILGSTGGEIKVRELDWMSDDFCSDADSAFSWSEEEVADLHDSTSILTAADVCYDDDLTDNLFRTLYRIASNLRKPSIIYLSIEKRMNFTIRHMDVSCEAYDHFRRCLGDLAELSDGRMRFSVEQVEPRFPQSLQYERVEQLELWKVTASFL